MSSLFCLFSRYPWLSYSVQQKKYFRNKQTNFWTFSPRCFIKKIAYWKGLRRPRSKFFSRSQNAIKMRGLCERIILIGVQSKKLWPLLLLISRCWFLTGPRFHQEFSYLLIRVNPSAFHNDEKGGSMSKNMWSSML